LLEYSISERKSRKHQGPAREVRVAPKGEGTRIRTEEREKIPDIGLLRVGNEGLAQFILMSHKIKIIELLRSGSEGMMCQVHTPRHIAFQ
jgi:hypothetical protein